MQGDSSHHNADDTINNAPGQRPRENRGQRRATPGQQAEPENRGAARTSHEGSRVFLLGADSRNQKQRIQVNLRVEQCDRQGREHDGLQAALGHLTRFQGCPAAAGANEGLDCKPAKERHPQPAENLKGLRHGHQGSTDAEHTQREKRDIRHHAQAG